MEEMRRDEPFGVTLHLYLEISHGNSLDGYLYLKQTKFLFLKFSLFSFTKLDNRRVEQSYEGRVVPMEGGRWWGNGVGKLIWCKNVYTCM
jgi:hypothetical protein